MKILKKSAMERRVSGGAVLNNNLAEHNKKGKKGASSQLFRGVLSLVLLLAIITAGMLEFLALTEYNPAES